MATPLRASVLALFMLLAAAPQSLAATARLSFPEGFLWGTAISGFQTEMGGRAVNADPRTDWWRWTHDRDNIAAGRVSGDLPERGPGFWSVYRRDIDLARRRLHLGAFRLGIEWSRIFPRSTSEVRVGRRITLRDLRRLDRLANRRAVRHYARVLERIRRRRMSAFVTLNHFTLPSWIHDPIAVRDAFAGVGFNDPLPRARRRGWLDRSTIAEFRKYAAYLGWKLGRLVDAWTPINEPLVVATNGYVNVPGVIAGNFPPGVFTFRGAIRVVENLALANEAAYDQVKRWDRRDADGDGVRSRVGLVQNLIAFTPGDPRSRRDRRGARHADYVFNRLFLNAAVRGVFDRNANGRVDRGEREPGRAGKADYIGVNYYFRSRVTGTDAPLTPLIPVLDFIPATSYRFERNPTGPPCPTTCTEFGWEVYPEGLRQVLRTVGRYRLPVYITENGLADARDTLRPSFLVRHLLVLRRVILDRLARVRGYFHWSLVDNFEWAHGYFPRFGLYRFDPATLRRRARPSARLFARIARGNGIPRSAARRHGGG